MMKYERPIMNISMFKLESIATTLTPLQGTSIPDPTNIEQAMADGKNSIETKAQRAMVVIQFNNGNTP